MPSWASMLQSSVASKQQKEQAIGDSGCTPDLSGLCSSKQDAVHICVCICTCLRPHLLERLLTSLRDQRTEHLFTYSIAVVDNDALGSANKVVETFAAQSPIPTRYCIEPRRGIVRARNKVMEIAKGDFFALIDDDEFASPTWLLNMYRACILYKVDGVLGPVNPHFDESPPRWLLESGFCNREIGPTGRIALWHETRTSNVLLKKECFANTNEPFRPEFMSGEDKDFFRRKIEEGRKFVWCAEGVVYEIVPRSRWMRSYWFRKGLFRGQAAALQPDCGPVSVLKSFAAIVLYLFTLPIAQIAGHHRFMILAVKICDHLGKLLAVVKLHPLKGAYYQ